MNADGNSAASSPSTTALRQALTDVLLVQTDADKHLDAVDCSDRDGGGLILTGEKSMIVAEHLLTQQRYSRPLLCDRERYAGKSRKFAHEPFDANWISQQRRLHLAAVIPDAGYVREDDDAGLASILTRVKNDLGPDVMAPLALHVSWLDRKRNLGKLLDHVQSAGAPIALALEHENDPLGERFAVKGLIELLKLPVPVMMLRCDISALGALCFGAIAAAVGTTTGLRHIYPLPKSDERRSFGRHPEPAAVVRGCLAYATLNKIDLAVQADRDNQMWSCTCLYCAGNTLDWLGSAPDPEIAAFLHSMNTLYQIRGDILGNNASLSDRQLSWISQCDSALFRYDELSGWRAPKALGNWTSLRAQLSGPST